MGFSSSLFGAGKKSKTDLIRQSAKRRIENDPMAERFGATASAIDSLPEAILMGLPEATIVTIVESYLQLQSRGLPDKEILKLIEAHRSMFGDSGELPNPLRLSSGNPQYIVVLEYFSPIILYFLLDNIF